MHDLEHPDTVLETVRLTLRPLQPEDWRDLREYVTREDVTRFDHPWPADEDGLQAAVAQLSRTGGFWAIRVRDAPAVIGHAACRRSDPAEFLNWDIGIGLHPAAQHRGYATEACARLLQHVFEVQGGRRVTASCHPDNEPAWRLLERLGMRREAHHRRSGFLRRTPTGEPLWSDAYEYAILADEWRAGRA